MLLVLALTGKAAVGIGGHTAWAGLGYTIKGPAKSGNCPAAPFLRRKENWASSEVMFVVVDEVGMLAAAELSNIDTMCGRLAGTVGLRFGGLHIITSGDFSQKGLYK